MASNGFKYFFISCTDRVTLFVKEHLKHFMCFGLFLVVGLVVGILSALKPIDPLAAFVTHNKLVYAVIEEAAYMSFVFSSLFTLLAIVLATSFVGRFSYSQIVLAVITIVLGYFQGGTVVLVIRVYGFIGLPFVICYALTSLALDLILFAHFALLWCYASERRKYGCRTPFLRALLGSVYIMLLLLVLLIAKYILCIVFSFFL